jgi:hypothetical protein
MKSVKEIPLHADSARAYFRDRLSLTLSVSNQVFDKYATSLNYWTVLSQDIPDARVNELAHGGMAAAQGTLQWLLCRLDNDLALEGSALLVEDFMARPSDTPPPGINLPRLLFGDSEVYYFVTRQSSTAAVLDKLLKVSGSANGFCVVTLSGMSVWFEPNLDTAITPSQIRRFIDGTRRIYLGAYDGEGVAFADVKCA